ncbi:MAG: cation transporter [archaeon]
MKEIIKVKGMHCKSCVNRIETSLKKLKGITNVKVNLIEETVEIEFNNKQISLDKIFSEIEKIDYIVQGKQKPKDKDNLKKGIFQGIVYGLIPHIGCILFIIGSILGVTLFTNLFKPLLMNKYFFYILFAVSFLFASISAIIYLSRNGLLSSNGIKKKWKYLSILYGSTIIVNIVLFFFIFPAVANIPSAIANQTYTNTNNSNTLTNLENQNNLETKNTISEIKLQVNIPCSGHAQLISSELKKLNGISSVVYSSPNYFTINYNSSIVSKEEILEIVVFKEYPATIISESNAEVANLAESTTTATKTITPISSCSSCNGSGSCSNLGGASCLSCTQNTATATTTTASSTSVKKCGCSAGQ